MNKALLIGNAGEDPEVRYLQQLGNVKVAQFSVATTERYKGRDGQPKENTEWHNIVCWRERADFAEKYIHKGAMLYVEGRIRTRSWEGQGGVKHYVTDIVADNIQLLDRKPADGTQPASGHHEAAMRTYAHSDSIATPEEMSTDNLPF